MKYYKVINIKLKLSTSTEFSWCSWYEQLLLYARERKLFQDA